MNYVEFCLAISSLAGVARFRVTSWWRSPVSNAKVGGQENSYHQLGMAVDIIPEARAEAERIRMFAPKLGLEVIEEKSEEGTFSHFHLEPIG